MSSLLKDAVLNGDQEEIKEIIKNMKNNENWSLITVIDELTPLLLMESNLTYGSFHLIKMSLFLREMQIKDYFSRDTEKKLIELISLLLSERDFVSIKSTRENFNKKRDGDYYNKLLEEINKGNAHNAYYYALRSLNCDRKKLSEFLLEIGSRFIPDSLGHSLSCFYPSVKDLIYIDSPHAETALLSYIMYLCRYSIEESHRQDLFGESSAGSLPANYSELTFKCASGKGIVNLHHMITLAVFMLW